MFDAPIDVDATDVVDVEVCDGVKTEVVPGSVFSVGCDGGGLVA